MKPLAGHGEPFRAPHAGPPEATRRHLASHGPPPGSRHCADTGIRVFNKTAESITGYTRAELEGRNWFEVLVPRERYPHVWHEFSQLAHAGIPERYENPILTKAGEERIISWRNSVMTEGDHAAGTISFGIDITEQRTAEEQLLHVQKMEAIRLYREHRERIALVILDLTMPGPSAADTLETLRALSPALKVLLASGHSVEGQAHALLARGCSGFLQKPFDLAALTSTLRELLRSPARMGKGS